VQPVDLSIQACKESVQTDCSAVGDSTHCFVPFRPSKKSA
jgi:hypothetical protein